jgi:predicted Fe-Mo cluster-binding NifX family protein
MMVDHEVKAVITGNVGPNAMNVLETAGIQAYKGLPVSVNENLAKFKDGLLSKIASAVPEHFGLQGGQK